MELHHTYIPQRSKSPLAHSAWNLTKASPWAHSSMDKYRHLGKDFNLEKIKNGITHSILKHANSIYYGVLK